MTTRPDEAFVELRNLARAACTDMDSLDMRYGLGIFFLADDAGVPFSEAGDDGDDDIRVPEGVRSVRFPAETSDAATERLVLAHLRALASSDDKAVLWHGANIPNVRVVIVPSGYGGDGLITIFPREGSGPAASHVLIIAEEASRAAVVVGPGRRTAQGFRSTFVHIHAMKDAKVTYAAAATDRTDGPTFSYLNASMDSGTSLRVYETVGHGAFTRARTEVMLNGVQAEAWIDSIVIGDSKDKADISHDVTHSADGTRSSISTRAVLSGAAKTVARGTIRIRPGTHGCEGRQRIDTLLLSRKAEMDAIPNLEIGTDDVTCGHAATIGDLDKEALFYLRSRGMDSETAKRMLIAGFLGAERTAGEGLRVRDRSVLPSVESAVRKLNITDV